LEVVNTYNKGAMQWLHWSGPLEIKFAWIGPELKRVWHAWCRQKRYKFAKMTAIKMIAVAGLG